MKKILSIIVVMALIMSLGSMLSVTTSAAVYFPNFENVATGNSFSTAKSINVNSSYYDNISEEDDLDYYKFTLSDAGSVYINFKHENLFDSDEYWVATLYNSNTEEISSFSFSGTDTNVDTYKVGLGSGTYYLEIHGGNWWSNNTSHCFSETTYTFNLKYTKSAYWEKENNEEFKTASKISLNKSYNGSVNDDADIDYYKFTLSSAGRVYINFKHENLYDSAEYWTATLYNSSTEEISYYSFLGTDTSVNTYKVGLAAGTYYLEIHGGNWWSNNTSHRFSEITYTFNLKYAETEYWEKENNEELKNASKVYLNKRYLGSVNDESDRDYYKFTVSEKSNIKLAFNINKQNSEEEYYIVSLYDSKSNEMLSQSIYGNKKTTYINTLLNSGTYYLEVHGGNWWSNNTSHCYTTDTYSFELQEILPKVSKITATQTTSTVTLKWSKVSKATGYIVYKYNFSAKKYVKYATTKSNTYKFKNLSVGKPYKFVVRAYKTKDGVTIYSDKSISTCTKPSTAKITSASASKKKSTIKWKKVSGADGYQIIYSTNNKFSNKKTVNISGGSKIKKTISSLKSNKKYYFKVRAYISVNGEKVYGAYSSVVSRKIK